MSTTTTADSLLIRAHTHTSSMPTTERCKYIHPYRSPRTMSSNDRIRAAISPYNAIRFSFDSLRGPKLGQCSRTRCNTKVRSSTDECQSFDIVFVPLSLCWHVGCEPNSSCCVVSRRVLWRGADFLSLLSYLNRSHPNFFVSISMRDLFRTREHFFM